MIRPILEYPVVPICVASRTNIKKLQNVQNKAIRRAVVRNPVTDHRTNADLHEETGLDTINIRLYNLASNVWRKMEEFNQELVEKTLQFNDIATNDHYWWPRIAPVITRGEPAPNY